MKRKSDRHNKEEEEKEGDRDMIEGPAGKGMKVVGKARERGRQGAWDTQPRGSGGKNVHGVGGEEVPRGVQGEGGDGGGYKDKHR